MAGTSNSGRKKLFEDPKEVHFTLEKEDYDLLMIEAKNDGYTEFGRYMRAIVKKVIN